MNTRKKINQKRNLRKKRVRSRIIGTPSRPRLSVFRSHRHIYAQLIDDLSKKTLISVSSKEINKKIKKTELSKKVGEMLADKAKKEKIENAVLDRGEYRYHGRVKSLTEGARESGLKI